MKFRRWLPVICLIILPAMVMLPCCTSRGASSQGDFPDYDTLSAWVAGHAQPFESGDGIEAWYQAALRVQREAASDGYLVSAVITQSPRTAGEYLVWCTALAGNDLYWWHPEDSECSLLFTKEELGIAGKQTGETE
jgi:hypothetical protein